MNGRHIHFVGIGGIGMSGIARLFLRRGIKVSGSDIKGSRVIEELRQGGAEVFLGHCAENLSGADVIVYSSAVRDDNPEIIEARKRGLSLIRRAEALAELMQGRAVITVTGSHGKTTTTSLASYMLMQAGLSPVVAVGGILRNINANSCDGNGRFFVAEADESDGSFLSYKPRYSIITNIDREHLDYYKDFPSIVESYARFLSQTDSDGCVFGCADDPHISKLLQTYPARKVLFGFNSDSDIYPRDVRIEGLSSSFECLFRGRSLGGFNLALGGMHNVSNALSVIALGLELGIDIPVIAKALNGYQGAKRRLEVKFERSGYLLIDDYAHHPTEIKATLAAVKCLNKKRVIAVFQPHRYTRTSLLKEEFSDSFSQVDCLIVTDIYSAGEPPIEGISGESLCRMIARNNPGKEVLFMNKDEIRGHIMGMIKPQDAVITLGAGDITKLSDELAEEFQRFD